MADRIEPFVIAADKAALDDLADRLRRARWPERETVGDWSQGVPLNYLQDLCGYWAGRYDWRAAEARHYAVHLLCLLKVRNKLADQRLCA